MKPGRGILPLAAVLILFVCAGALIRVLHLPAPQGEMLLLGVVIIGAALLFRRQRPPTQPAKDGRATFYFPGSALERLTTAALPDGNVVVYPYAFLREGFVLTPEQFARYRDWQAGRLTRRALNLWMLAALLLVLLGLAASAAMHPDDPLHAFPEIMLAGLVLILAAGLFGGWLPSRQAFHEAFPQALRRMRDPNRGRRRLLYLMTRPIAGLGACSLFALLGVAALGVGGPTAWESYAAGKAAPLDIAAYLVWFVALPLFILFHAVLAWQHVMFRLRHHRAPTVTDIDTA